MGAGAGAGAGCSGGDTSPPGGLSSPGLGTQDGVADRDQMPRFRGLVVVFASAAGNWY